MVFQLAATGLRGELFCGMGRLEWELFNHVHSYKYTVTSQYWRRAILLTTYINNSLRDHCDLFNALFLTLLIIKCRNVGKIRLMI